MIKRQRTFAYKCRFKENFRKILFFFLRKSYSVTLTFVGLLFFPPLQRLHGCGKQSKKRTVPRRQQLFGKALGSTNPVSKKIVDFSTGSRTTVLTFPALYSGDDGSTREHYPAIQVVMLPRFLQNKCHHKHSAST